MPDYNLNGLNDRTFEHVVQAIAKKEIASGVIPFGDGPDGGREATFNGKMTYPSLNAPWEGYLVIQSKFKLHPTGDPKADGEWFIKQLSKDLEKFLDPKRHLKRPEYYLATTNIRLTAVADTGTRDRVSTVLKAAAEKLGLKGCDVWGYDELCRFLDNNEDVRKANYSELITKGDLADQWKKLCELKSQMSHPTDRFSNLAILRDKVKQFWIQGVLEHSIPQQAVIALGRELIPDAVESPWAGVVELQRKGSNLLLPAKRTSEVFRDCGRSLLILGELGSGKTATLLDLARDLINDSELDREQPVPVVFNLSSWSLKRPPLLNWLVGELNAKYSCPKKLAKFWLEQNCIVLLLDGLDEMPPTAQSACIAEIHNYQTEHGASGIAMCSRTKGYAALRSKLKLNAAIALQPLGPKQIDQYLDQVGEDLSSLRQAMAGDTTLQELARTPLWLGVMSRAYQEATHEQLVGGTFEDAEQRREHIFKFYTERMLTRQIQGTTAFNKERTLKWLGWLARYMLKRSESVFLIEGLQPDCFGKPGHQDLYIGISRGLSGAFFIALSLMAFTSIAGLSITLVRSTVALIGALAGSCACSIELLLFRWTDRASKEPTRRAGVAARICLYAIACFVLSFVPLFLSRQWIFLKLFFPLLIFNGVSTALIVGLPLALVFGTRAKSRTLGSDIRTLEHFTWSWRLGCRGLLRGATYGIVIAIVFGALFVIISPHVRFGSGMAPASSVFSADPPKTRMIIACMFLLLCGVAGAGINFVFRGLATSISARKTRANQGIHLSLRNSLVAGLLIGLTAGVLMWLCLGDPDFPFPAERGFAARLQRVAVVGGAVGFVTMLCYGGFDVIQHFILRLLLWRGGIAPRNFGLFLDYASRVFFLQRVGGGYIFINRILLNYFAKIGEEHFIAEQNIAVCLVWKCPECAETTDFLIIEYVTGFKRRSSDPSHLPSKLYLRCARCECEFLVKSSEHPMIELAHDITTQFKQHRLTTEAYREKIAQLPARFIQDIVNPPAAWNCRKCGEENPANFEFCWNCASKEAPPAEANEDTAPFPHFPPSGHPWEK
jgi:hypothetical protein